jgi:hypothetical protein
MPPSKVIRIDEEVWAELQKRARPLEDTPNSVLRRVFGLPDEGSEADGMDSRITTLLELAEESLGKSHKCMAKRRTTHCCPRLERLSGTSARNEKGSG